MYLCSWFLYLFCSSNNGHEQCVVSELTVIAVGFHYKKHSHIHLVSVLERSSIVCFVLFRQYIIINLCIAINSANNIYGNHNDMCSQL